MNPKLFISVNKNFPRQAVFTDYKIRGRAMLDQLTDFDGCIL